MQFNSNKKRVPLYHVASMARSGETMLMHMLARHSSIQVVHNLRNRDQWHEKFLFHYLMKYSEQSMHRLHPLLMPYPLKSDSILLLKQGVWKHRYPFQGIVFSRNPLSIFSSLKYYGVSASDDWKLSWSRYRVPRFIAWLKKIDKNLLEGFENKTPVEQFCLFYNKRMNDLFELDNPIIRYEEFVENPEKYARLICDECGVSFESAMLWAAEGSSKAGHGHYDSTREIDQSSILKYSKKLDVAEMDYLIKNTCRVAALYGYTYEQYALKLSPVSR